MKLALLFLFLAASAINTRPDIVVKDKLDELGFSEYIIPNEWGIEFYWFYQDQTSYGMNQLAYDFFDQGWMYNKVNRTLMKSFSLTRKVAELVRFMRFEYPLKEYDKRNIEKDVLSEDLRQTYEKYFGVITSKMVNQSCLILKEKYGYDYPYCDPETQPLTPISDAYIIGYEVAFNWTCGKIKPFLMVEITDLGCIPPNGINVWNAFVTWRKVFNDNSQFFESLRPFLYLIDYISGAMNDPAGFDEKSILVSSEDGKNAKRLPAYTVSSPVKAIYEGLENEKSKIIVQNDTFAIQLPENIQEYLNNRSFLIPFSIIRQKVNANYSGVTKLDFKPQIIEYRREGLDIYPSGWFSAEMFEKVAENCDSDWGFKFEFDTDNFPTLSEISYISSALIAKSYSIEISEETYRGIYDISGLNSTDPEVIMKGIKDSIDVSQISQHYEYMSSWRITRGDTNNYMDFPSTKQHSYVIALKPNLLFPKGVCRSKQISVD